MALKKLVTSKNKLMKYKYSFLKKRSLWKSWCSCLENRNWKKFLSYLTKNMRFSKFVWVNPKFLFAMIWKICFFKCSIWKSFMKISQNSAFKKFMTIYANFALLLLQIFYFITIKSKNILMWLESPKKSKSSINMLSQHKFLFLW